MMVIKYKQKYRSISAAGRRQFCSTQHEKYQLLQRASACVSATAATLHSLLNYKL